MTYFSYFKLVNYNSARKIGILWKQDCMGSSSGNLLQFANWKPWPIFIYIYIYSEKSYLLKTHMFFYSATRL